MVTGMTISAIHDAAGLDGRWKFAPHRRTDGMRTIEIAFVRPDGGGFTSSCPIAGIVLLVEQLIERGDVDAARDAAAAWLAALADKHGVRGLEYTRREA